MIRTELNFHGHREIRKFVRSRNTTIGAGYFGAVLSCGAPSGEDALVFSDAGPIGPVGDEYFIVRPVLQDLAVINGDAHDDEPYRVAVAFLTGNKNPDGFYRFESGDDLSENPYRAYEAALKGLYQSLVGNEDAWWPEDGVACDDVKIVAKTDWEEDIPILIEGSDGEVREDTDRDFYSVLLRLAGLCKRSVMGNVFGPISGIVAGTNGHTVMEGWRRKYECSGGMAGGVDALVSTHFATLKDNERLVLFSDYAADTDYAMVVALDSHEDDTHAFLKAAHQVLHHYGDKYKTYAVRERLFLEV